MIERSFYPGTTETIDDLKKEYGMTGTEYVFTSMQLNHDSFKWMTSLFDSGYQVITDISKETLRALDMTVEMLYQKYPQIICRLDDGYSEAEILSLSERHAVILNASTVSSTLLEKINGKHKISAMFNYYPKPLTGMTEAAVKELTEKLQEKGLEVYAFIPGSMSRRGPVHAGLPTIEAHRYDGTIKNYLSLKSLNIDKIFLGDEYLTECEVTELAALKNGVLKMKISTEYPDIFEQVNDLKVSARRDQSEYLHRFSGTRGQLRKFNLKDSDKVKLISKGDILIDGPETPRYAGEIQIARKDAFAGNYPFYKIGETAEESMEYIPEQYTIQFEWE